MSENIKDVLDSIKEAINKNDDSIDSFLIGTECWKELLDYITNLQEIEKEHKNCTKKHWQQKCAEHCANEMIYKSRIDKAIEILKLCNSKCAKETIAILKGEK